MKDRQFDNVIRDALKDKTKNCIMREEKRMEIIARIRQENKEEQNMRRISKGKVLIAVAVMCLMATVAVAAAGKIAYMTSSVRTDQPQFSSFAELKDLTKKLGAPARAVEKFQNGMQFEDAYITDIECLDADGNKVSSYPELMVNYKNNGNTVFLNVSEPIEQAVSSKTPLSTTESNGQTLEYFEDHYAFFPPDAEPSAEDLELEKKGELYISYGSQNEERKDFYYVTWKEGNLTYLINSWEVQGQDLLDMATEVAGAQAIE